jgi:hypothetical protein
MTRVRKAFAEDFERVYPLFMGFREPRPDKETFRQLFVRRWDGNEDHFGCILEDDGKPVGFLGTVHSTRSIDGRPERFCNLSCWIVEKDYRTEGLSLLFNVLKEKDTTFTNFTGVKVAPILKHFGFSPLDEFSKILLPLPRPSALGCDCKVRLDAESFESQLDDADLRIYQDHLPFKFTHVLLSADNGYSYLIVQKVRRKRLPVAEVHYLSQLDSFLQHAPHLLPSLCLKLGVTGLLVGEHFLRGRVVRPALTIPQRLPRLFRSASVSAEEMDTLYSELQVLNL